MSIFYVNHFLRATATALALASPIAATAQDVSRPLLTSPNSAIFNADATDFVGVTVNACTSDGQAVSVTANPVAPKSEIIAHRAEGLSGAYESATSGIQTNLRSYIAGEDLAALQGAARFGQTQSVPEITTQLQESGFPHSITGVNLFITPKKDDKFHCLIS